MNRILLFVFILISLNVTAQEADENIQYKDHVYLDNIRSVKFHLAGLPLSLPIVDLNSNATLLLSFDDLDADTKDYTYSIQLCNADWSPADLTEMEYIDGFNNEDITDYEFSFNTLTDFTHYRVALPNSNMRWLKSGNYLLKVYEDEDEKRLAITRRFCVVDPIIQINPKLVPTSKVSKLKTHHEFDFSITYKGVKIASPLQEIRAVVLQNGRWDSAITDIKPVFLRQEELAFDYQDKILFPAGKEYRYVDLRSFDYKTDRVYAIDEYSDKYEVTLFTDKVRAYQNYIFQNDINGNYVIENVHRSNNDLQGDYAHVLFSLSRNAPFYEADVYLFGMFSDWELKEEFKLDYSEEDHLYFTEVKLKQGYYNYEYVMVPKGSALPDAEELEGNWYETENDYTILVYYRPFSARHDLLVGAYTFKSQ